MVVVLNFIFYLYLFSLLVSHYPFFFWSFRELSNFEICFASFVLFFKEIIILSFFSVVKNFGEILLFCTTSWLSLLISDWVVFLRLWMNPIRSAPHQQVVRKRICYSPCHFVSRAKIVIQYEMLSNLALIIGRPSMQIRLIDCLANRQRKQQI